MQKRLVLITRQNWEKIFVKFFPSYINYVFPGQFSKKDLITDVVEAMRDFMSNHRSHCTVIHETSNRLMFRCGRSEKVQKSLVSESLTLGRKSGKREVAASRPGTLEPEPSVIIIVEENEHRIKIYAWN